MKIIHGGFMHPPSMMSGYGSEQHKGVGRFDVAIGMRGSNHSQADVVSLLQVLRCCTCARY